MNIVARVILPLGQVPDRAIITKRTGSKYLLVKDTITIYNADGHKQELHTTGCKFVVDPESGSINAMSVETDVVWFVPPHEADELLDILGLSETPQ